MKRRRFVTVAASLATVGLAGCGEAGPGADTDTETGDDGPLDGETDGPGDGGVLDGTETRRDGMASPGDGTATPGDGTASPRDGEGDDRPAEGDDEPFDLDEIEGEVGRTPENLVVVESRLVETAEGAAVVGTVRNLGGESFEFVEVEVVLDDGDTLIGEFVDTSEAEIDELGPGETWRFIVTFDDEEVTGATGYTINVEGDLADEDE